LRQVVRDGGISWTLARTWEGRGRVAGPFRLARFENSPLPCGERNGLGRGRIVSCQLVGRLTGRMVTVDKTDWQPVTDAAGKVLGWTAAPDRDEPDVDYFRADWSRKVRCRAARLEEAAGLFADDAFDFEESWAAGEAAGLSEADLDSAANVALVIWLIEHGRD
jgi:hypothetical protein